MGNEQCKCDCLRELALTLNDLSLLSERIMWDVAGVGDLSEKLFPDSPAELIEARQASRRAKDFRESLEKAVKCGVNPMAPGGPLRGTNMVNHAKDIEQRLTLYAPRREDIMRVDALLDALLDTVQLYCRE